MSVEILALVRAGPPSLRGVLRPPRHLRLPRPGNGAASDGRGLRRAAAARDLVARLPLVQTLGSTRRQPAAQIYHATDLVLQARLPDTASTLVLLQISVIGQPAHLEQPDWSRLPVLVDYLLAYYPGDHEVIAYEASPYPIAQPIIVRVPLAGLADVELRPAMTLVVPPATAGVADPDMARRLKESTRARRRSAAATLPFAS